MGSGIAPQRLLSQIENTAGWALENEAVYGDAVRVARKASDVEAAWNVDAFGAPYLEFMLAAHYLTVCTFVPTDVDARIRHHHWAGITDGEKLREAVSVVERVAAWDARLVSDRVAHEGDVFVSGHDGEWFSVRAGALGCAIAVGDDSTADALEATIDAELAREADLFTRIEAKRDLFMMLRAATLLAHNTGDLSRVASEWPAAKKTSAPGHARAAELAARYTRLGHEGEARHGGAFVRAGALNKRFMANENHRFLPLREPRCLRRSRELLLPLGPFFDDWGASIAKHAALDEEERATVVAALLDLALRRPEDHGPVRAMIGMAEATKGGMGAYAQHLPARARKELQTGDMPRRLGVPRRAFEERLRSQCESATRGR